MHEKKVDATRMLAYKDGTKVRLVSRHGIDHTHRYPVMAAAVALLTPRTTVLDGETGGVRQAAPLTLCLAAPPSARRAGHTARAHRVRRPAGAERPRAAAPLSAHAGTAAGPGDTRLLPTAGHSATGCGRQRRGGGLHRKMLAAGRIPSGRPSTFASSPPRIANALCWACGRTIAPREGARKTPERRVTEGT